MSSSSSVSSDDDHPASLATPATARSKTLMSHHKLNQLLRPSTRPKSTSNAASDASSNPDTVAWALWKRLLEQRKEDEGIVARLGEDKAVLFLPVIPVPSAETVVDLKTHVYYGQMPKESASVFFGEAVYGPVDVIGEGGAKATMINDYVSFLPAPLSSNTDDPVQESGLPPKRNVQMVVPVIRTRFPDEDFNQTVTLCLLRRSPHPPERAGSVYSSGSTAGGHPPRRSSSLPRISEKERLALALAKQRQMEEEFQVLVSSSPVSESSGNLATAGMQGAVQTRGRSQKPRPGSLMIEEVFKNRRAVSNDGGQATRSAPGTGRASPLLSTNRPHSSTIDVVTRPVLRGSARNRTADLSNASLSRSNSVRGSAAGSTSGDTSSDEVPYHKELTDIDVEMGRAAVKKSDHASSELAADAAWRDLIRYLRSFITEFEKSVRGPASTPGGVPSTIRPAEDCAEEFQQFMLHIQEQLHAMDRLPSDMGFEETIEWIENYLCQHLFPIIFSPAAGCDDRSMDRTLDIRISALATLSIDVEHLGLSVLPEERPFVERLVLAAGKELLKLDAYNSPKEKLNVIAAVHKLITDSLQESHVETVLDKPVSGRGSASKHDKRQSLIGALRRLNSGADTVLPLLIYVVIRTNPPRLVSNMRYIQRYRADSGLQDYYSYCFTNMSAVVAFLETADLQELGLTNLTESSATASPSTQQRSLGRYMPQVPTVPTPHALLSAGVRGGKEVGGAVAGGVSGVVGIFGRMLGKPNSSSHAASSTSLPEPLSEDKVAPPREVEMRDFSAYYPGMFGKKASSIHNISASASIDPLRFAAPDERYLALTPETIRVADIPGLLEEYKRVSALLVEMAKTPIGLQ